MHFYTQDNNEARKVCVCVCVCAVGMIPGQTVTLKEDLRDVNDRHSPPVSTNAPLSQR